MREKVMIIGILFCVVTSPLFAGESTSTITLPVFIDITEESGVHVLPRKIALPSGGTAFFHGSMTTFHSAGVALEDLDLDGNLDLVICDVGKLHIFKGDGTGRFTPALSGILLLHNASFAASGIAIGDIDGNGYPDIYVSVINGTNQLFLNKKKFKFEEKAEAYLVADTGIGFSVNMVDYDNDGDIDLFVCNYGSFLKDRFNINMQLKGTRDPSDDSDFRQRNVLYRNNGNGTFTDVTESAGLTAEDFSFASAFADYDHDGDQDLYIANDFGISRLYQNNGNGTFSEITDQMGYVNVGTGMSVMWGDVNNDGRFDLLVGNMFSHSSHRLMDRDYALFSQYPKVIRIIFDRIVSGDSLLVQQKDGTFENRAEELNVNDGSWSWGTIFSDFNLDGWLDIYGANGWTRGKESKDYCMTAWSGVLDGMRQIQQGTVKKSGNNEGRAAPKSLSRKSLKKSLRYKNALRMIRAFTEESSPSEKDVLAVTPFLDKYGNLDIDTKHIPRLGRRSWDGYNKNVLFVNSGEEDKPFVGLTTSPVLMDDVSKTVTAGDIDNDGDLDLVVVSQTTPVKIFRNISPRKNWIIIKLKGSKNNQSGIGARVIVYADGRQWHKQVTSGEGFCSHQSLELEFGLGEIKKIDRVEVQWPLGNVQIVKNPHINKRLTIQEKTPHEGKTIMKKFFWFLER